MNKKLKLALAALLGFSAACTSVKNAPKEQPEQTKNADSTLVKGYSDFPRRAITMYGVRTPLQDSIRKKRMEDLQRERPDTLPPVAERPREEDPVPVKK